MNGLVGGNGFSFQLYTSLGIRKFKSGQLICHNVGVYLQNNTELKGGEIIKVSQSIFMH